MRVIRQIIYEGTEEHLAHQLKLSAPNGKFSLPSIKWGELTILVETLEEPDSSLVHKMIQYAPGQWPRARRVEDAGQLSNRRWRNVN